MYSVDVPRALEKTEDFEDGDGAQWQLGSLVAMRASAMNAPTDFAITCARSANVVAHRETPNMCWASGKRDGYVFWQRTDRTSFGVASLELEYVESLKTAMDPIVTHVNASWSFGRLAPIAADR